MRIYDGEVDGFKRCSKCKAIKPFHDYNRNVGMRFNLHSQCRECLGFKTRRPKRTLNKRYPGRPNYTGPKSGFFLLPFHSDLVMWMPDILNRLNTIYITKPRNEIARRRHCMVYVRPKELPTAVVATLAAFRKPCAAHLKAYVAYREAYAAQSKDNIVWEKASAAYQKAYADFSEVLITHNKPLTALLTKYVRDHTWNGKKLVFK